MRPIPASRRSVAAALTALALLAAASLPAQEVRYGPASSLGDGTLRTYLSVDPNGTPLELGVALSEDVLLGLPEGELPLDLPIPDGNPTPYRFVNLVWNPNGHIPHGIYTVPHFDVHFYLIDPATRDAIVPADPADAAELEVRGSRPPEEGFMAAGYVNPGGSTLPRMGSHWIDPASHEFHDESLDKTFIYGTWDGRLVFAEPMIARAYLESRPDVTVEIPTPARYARPGWYASAYRVAWDEVAGEYRVALTGFSEWE